MTTNERSTKTFIKFCGFVSADDVDVAVQLGIDAVGFILAPSPRRRTVEEAAALALHIPDAIATICVMTDPTDAEFYAARAAMPQMIPQFCGSESLERCRTLTAGGAFLKVMHMPPTAGSVSNLRSPVMYSKIALREHGGRAVFDTAVIGRGGGSGCTFDWTLLADAAHDAVIAGGLRPENVAACIAAARPYGVDVRSGIETGQKKDFEKMRAFVAAVRSADEHAARIAKEDQS